MKKAFIQLHMAIFLAGFTAVLGRLISLNEAILVWYRLLITVVLLALFMYFKKELILPSKKDVLKMVGVGAVITFHWVTFYGSVKYGNISIALVCLSSAGFFSSILEPLIFKQKFIIAEMLLGILTVIGIYIIFDFHPQYKVGIAYGILCALGSALFPIFNKQLVNKFSPRTLTLYELSGGLVLLSFIIPAYLKYAPVNSNNITAAVQYVPTFSDFMWLLVLAVMCTIICFDLQLQALKKISAFTSNLMYNLEPVYGIILAFMFFNEGNQLNNAFYIGTLLIISAIVIQIVRVYRQQKVS
jgi:drug/metabolite transporter (DMT)-like permease